MILKYMYVYLPHLSVNRPWDDCGTHKEILFAAGSMSNILYLGETLYCAYHSGRSRVLGI